MKYKNKYGKYSVYDENIPQDNYEVTSIIQDKDGTKITLTGRYYSVSIVFGFVNCLCICDEGARIESYNRIEDIREYRKNNFNGNPFYKVTMDSGFMNWLEFESCGFSRGQEHYAVITLNDFIDIAADFPPQITITK